MAWFSARRGSGGGGKVGEKGEGTESHLWVSLVRGEEVLGSGSTCAGGRRRHCAAAAAFQRLGAAVEGLGRTSEGRGSSLEGWFWGRRGAGGSSTWRPWAAAVCSMAAARR